MTRQTFHDGIRSRSDIHHRMTDTDQRIAISWQSVGPLVTHALIR